MLALYNLIAGTVPFPVSPAPTTTPGPPAPSSMPTSTSRGVAGKRRGMRTTGAASAGPATAATSSAPLPTTAALPLSAGPFVTSTNFDLASAACCSASRLGDLTATTFINEFLCCRSARAVATAAAGLRTSPLSTDSGASSTAPLQVQGAPRKSGGSGGAAPLYVPVHLNCHLGGGGPGGKPRPRLPVSAFPVLLFAPTLGQRTRRLVGCLGSALVGLTSLSWRMIVRAAILVGVEATVLWFLGPVSGERPLTLLVVGLIALAGMSRYTLYASPLTAAAGAVTAALNLVGAHPPLTFVGA